MWSSSQATMERTEKPSTVGFFLGIDIPNMIAF
jgi:hypothetical protein